MSVVERTKYPGVYARHQRGCPVDSTAKPPVSCKCSPTYQAKVSLPGRRQRSESFASTTAARAWRVDAKRDAEQGRLRPRTVETLRDAWLITLAGIRNGTVMNRSDEPYAPRTITAYETAMRLRVLPALGGRRLGDISKRDVEMLVSELRRPTGDGRVLGAATIGNTLMPLQVVYRQGWVQDLVSVDPTLGVSMPRRQPREGSVLPALESVAIVESLADIRLRSFWVLVLFAGLRRSEALALRWEDVAFDEDPAGLYVRASKTDAGIRWVPLLDITRRVLLERRTQGTDETVVGLGETRVRRLSLNLDRSGEPIGEPLVPIVPHDARKTFASILGDAGVSPEALTRVLGHKTYETTRNHYLREMPAARRQLADAVKGAVGH